MYIYAQKQMKKYTKIVTMVGSRVWNLSHYFFFVFFKFLKIKKKGRNLLGSSKQLVRKKMCSRSLEKGRLLCSMKGGRLPLSGGISQEAFWETRLKIFHTDVFGPSLLLILVWLSLLCIYIFNYKYITKLHKM